MRTLTKLAAASLALALTLAGACNSTRVPPPADSTHLDRGAGSTAVGASAESPRLNPVFPEPLPPPREAMEDSTLPEELRRLQREAVALANPAGCERDGDCRTAPVGSRPCGGPRTYVVYCARTTDSVALYRKLDQLAKAEEAYNKRENLASTCEFREAPAVVASGGSCRRAP